MLGETFFYPTWYVSANVVDITRKERFLSYLEVNYHKKWKLQYVIQTKRCIFQIPMVIFSFWNHVSLIYSIKRYLSQFSLLQLWLQATADLKIAYIE